MSRNKRNAIETQHRILHTAEIHFAEKGFNGARVDEIAKDAGINKAMIYYYFRSKQNLLDHLLQHFVRESLDLFMDALRDNSTIDLQKLASLDMLEPVIDRFLTYLEKKKPILQILLTQAIRGEKEGTMLFHLIGETISKETDVIIQQFEEYGMEVNMERNQMLVTEFFTSIFPIIMYTVFQDSLTDYLKVSKNELKNYFIKSLELTHVAYHKNLYNEHIKKMNSGENR